MVVINVIFDERKQKVVFFKILKKDIKRKKTMNIILLFFVVLSSMFASSSANNIITVINGVDNFFEKAQVPDCALMISNEEDAKALPDILESMSEVKEYRYEFNFLLGTGIRYKDKSSSGMIVSDDNMGIVYFDKNNDPIKNVEPGTIYVVGKFMDEFGVKSGDDIAVEFHGESYRFKVAGYLKDAIYGSTMAGAYKFIINAEDFKRIVPKECKLGETGKYYIYYVHTDDADKVLSTISQNDIESVNFKKSAFKITYIMDTLTAMVLLVLGIFLISIALAVLRFTISITISEDYREIGVMKAIGIKEKVIRKIYLTKYLVIAVAGSLTGFVAGIPFGKFMLAGAPKSIVLENENMILISVLCCISIVLITGIFSFGCTAKINRLSPVNAINNGSTGETFKKKSKLHLEKCRLSPAKFIALSDIFARPKRFIVITLVYTLSLCMVLILANTANTLGSSELIRLYGIKKSDVYINDMGLLDTFTSDDKIETLKSHILKTEEMLKKNGMDASCMCDLIVTLNVSYKENDYRAMVFQGIGASADMYDYCEGTPPRNADEIAVTTVIADTLGVSIGDTITIHMDSGNKDFIITALYQSMYDMGNGIRLHETARVDYSQIYNFMGLQVDFNDSPSDKVIEQRIRKIEKLYDHDERIQVWSAEEYALETVGTVVDAINAVKIMTIILSVIIIALITILMERSFIEDEKTQISLLKAMGFKTGTVIKSHIFKFAFLCIPVTVLSLVLNYPLTNLIVNPVFSAFGANLGIDYVIKPLEIFILYPAIILCTTVLSAFFTSLYTKKITASQISMIE